MHLSSSSSFAWHIVALVARQEYLLGTPRFFEIVDYERDLERAGQAMSQSVEPNFL